MIFSCKPQSEPAPDECHDKRKVGQVLSPNFGGPLFQPGSSIIPSRYFSNQISVRSIHGVSPLYIFAQADYEVLCFGFYPLFLTCPVPCIRGGPAEILLNERFGGFKNGPEGMALEMGGTLVKLPDGGRKIHYGMKPK